MNATLRKAGRGSTLVIGSIALAFSLAACGGSESSREAPADEETTEEAAAEEEATSEEGMTEEETTEEEAEAAGSAEDVTEDDLAASEQQFIEFVTAVSDGDFPGACGFVLNPETSEPMSGADAEACGKGMESSGVSDTFTPDMASLFTEENLEASANEDGTIAMSLMGSDSGMQMVKGSDGKWYIDGSALGAGAVG